MDNWLIDDILTITKSKRSINFYKKAIKLLGEARVESELGEVKHQIRLGKVRDPARYFTTPIKNSSKPKRKQGNGITATRDKRVGNLQKSEYTRVICRAQIPG